MESAGKDPLRALASLVHLCPEHDMARCQLVTAALLAVWQLTGRSFSETAPSFMLVNCSPDRDVVWTALTDILKRCMEVPEGSTEQDTIIFGNPNRGNPALSRQTMRAYMARMRTVRGSGVHPAQVEAEIKKLIPQWTRIKAEVFPNPALRQLRGAWDDDFGFVSPDDECISLLVPDSKNRGLLRKLLSANPALDSMAGVGSSIEFVPKRVALIGAVPTSDWDARLTRELLRSSLPVFFLPGDSPTTIQFPDVDLLRSLVFRFIRHFRFGVPPAPADPSRVALDDESLEYLNLIDRLTKDLPGDAAFRIQFLLRQLYSVVSMLTLMAAPTQANPGTAYCAPGHLVRDLYVTALRGIAYGVAALRFHCIGLPRLENDPHAEAALDFLRRANRPVSRRDIRRKLYVLKAKDRDALLARLNEAELVTVKGRHVEAVCLADYLSGIPKREKFPAVTLLTREPDAAGEDGRSSAP